MKKKKKKKGDFVKFELIFTKDKDGKVVQHFVPKKLKFKKDDEKSESKVNKILAEYCDSDDDLEKEDDLPDYLKDYEKIKSKLTEEEIERYTVKGMFPNDGFDYSTFVADERNSSVGKNVEDVETEVVSVDDFGEDEETKKLDKELFENAEEIIIKEGDEGEGEYGEDFTIFDMLDENFSSENLSSSGGTFEGGMESTTTKKKRPRKRKKKKVINPQTVKSKTGDREKRILNEAFQKMLEKFDDDLFGDEDEGLDPELKEFDPGENTENSKGTKNITEIKYTIDEFFNEQRENDLIKYLDSTHSKDGRNSVKLTEKEIEELSKNVPEGMMILTSKLKKKLKKGDVDREEIVEIMLERLKKRRELEEKGELYTTEESDQSGEEEGEVYDVESILTTYTNTENRPVMLKEGGKKIIGKKIVRIVPEEEKLNFDILESGVEPVERKRGETLEEKKKRKKLVKKRRKEKRKFKKKLKRFYKSEFNKRTNVVKNQTRNKKISIE